MERFDEQGNRSYDMEQDKDCHFDRKLDVCWPKAVACEFNKFYSGIVRLPSAQPKPLINIVFIQTETRAISV